MPEQTADSRSGGGETPAPRLHRIAACFDGTWNTDRSNTNVSRLFRKIADLNSACPEQARFYDEGVGTKWGERLRGGMLGMGLDRNIRDGYAWLGTQFPLGLDPASARDPDGFLVGPQLFLLGFSRGAFTARSLAGLINYLGLPKLGGEAVVEPTAPLRDHPVVREAWALYAARPTRARRDEAQRSPGIQREIDEHDQKLQRFRATNAFYPVRIEFLGVWDTVGALGIPRVLDYKWIPRFSSQYLFHDTQLGRAVQNAYHAVAIDEQREPYCVTLWTASAESRAHVEQRWFPGAHADVGGGYEDTLLPDPPLAWIAAKAAGHGLHFVNDRAATPPSVPQPPAAFDLDGREYLSPVHDSYAEFMDGTYRVLRTLPGAGGRVYRRMLVAADGIGQAVDQTALKKLDADPAYRPPNLVQAGRVDVSFELATLPDPEADTGER
jgi:uncharacterized protein (DUF2235 family)